MQERNERITCILSDIKDALFQNDNFLSLNLPLSGWQAHKRIQRLFTVVLSGGGEARRVCGFAFNNNPLKGFHEVMTFSFVCMYREAYV